MALEGPAEFESVREEVALRERSLPMWVHNVAASNNSGNVADLVVVQTLVDL